MRQKFMKNTSIYNMHRARLANNSVLLLDPILGLHTVTYIQLYPLEE